MFSLGILSFAPPLLLAREIQQAMLMTASANELTNNGEFPM